MTGLTKIVDKTVAPIETDLDGWTKLEGNPTIKTWIEYTSPDESMITGCWEATPGLYHAVYAGWEFVHLIEGDVVVTPDDGDPQSFGPGDAFMLEKGFSGTWLIKSKVYKHFAIKLK